MATRWKFQVDCAGAIASLLLVTSCATGLGSVQQQELKAYEARGLKIVEDQEGLAVFLGFLPGGGSFYTGNFGYGIVNLIFWPLSIFWDPISGYNGAQSNNYIATRAHVSKLQNDEMDALDAKLQSKQIELTEYMVVKEAINRKYKP